MDELVLQLAPGYTVTLQPSVRDGATYGDPIVPSVDGDLYTFNISGLPVGDYDMQLNGDWQIDGQPFALRKTATDNYYDDFWWQVDLISGGSPINPGPPGLCTVRFSVRNEAGTIANAVIEAGLDVINATIENSLIAQTKTFGVTGANGICDLVLIRRDSFTAGGIYHIVVTQPCGKVMFDKRCYIMNASEGMADDLVAV